MKGILGLLLTVLGGWIVLNLLGALLVGAIARAILPGRDRIGWGLTLLIGFLGGLLGRLCFWILHWPTRFPMGFVASVLGAFVLLLAHRLVVARRPAPPVV